MSNPADRPVLWEARALRVLSSTLAQEDSCNRASLHRFVTWAMGDAKRLEGLIRALIGCAEMLQWSSRDALAHAETIERPFTRPRKRWTGINTWHWEAPSMKWKTCPTCGGAGEQEYWEKDRDGKLVKKQRACSTCHGAGSVPDTN